MHIPPVAQWFLQGVVAFVLLLVVIFLTIFAINFAHKVKAESLLRDIQTLRAGESTTADVQQIMKRHGGGPSQSSYASFCDPMDGAYDVWTGSRAIYWLNRYVPSLRRLGLRPWSTGATVVVREGRVCYLYYGFGMEAPNGEWEWGAQSILLPDGQIGAFDGKHLAYRVGTRDFKGVRSLRSELTPEATEEQRRRAFTYDFSCVVRFRGCRQRCEIAPLVWQDVYRQSLNTESIMPVEETEDSHCKLAEQAH